MGLPQILIEFKTKAETAVTRSERGIVAVILADDTNETTSYSYNYAADISSDDWTTTNLDYLNKVFLGTPNKVLVERMTSSDTYASVLAKLKTKSWNWLAAPCITSADDTETVMNWITTQRDAKKTFKAVLPCSAFDLSPNNEGIVDFATDDIVAGSKTYTTAEYCARIAGLLAGLSMTESATYQVLAEVTSITDSEDADTDIDEGRFILINDGEKIKVGRGINSLHILSGDKTEDMEKIKIIEGMDLMRDDIRETFEENYIGVNNSYDNKQLFVSAVNQYFANLASQGVLYDEYDNTADIDVDAQREWLSEKYDITDYTDDDIRKAKTGSYVFITASVQFADAIEDLEFVISME